MYYPQFTKVIIHYFLTQDKTLSWRNKIGMHTSKDDYLINTLRFVFAIEETQIYGAIIPESLTSLEMKETKAYKTYLETPEMPLSRKKEKVDVTRGNDEDDSNNKQDSSGKDNDQKNDSDDNKTQSDNENESGSEHETDENESGPEFDQEEGKDDEEEVKDELVKTMYNNSDDVDVLRISPNVEVFFDLPDVDILDRAYVDLTLSSPMLKI
ncbi:hypothetical protein Tco_0874849 [Tanacetum coccineum]|uniref:Uncharacterized protein n=1 Tax=Tanacetum coccineum TaxID=301880 RepID=A0ABQ5BRG1_9ASTR